MLSVTDWKRRSPQDPQRDHSPLPGDHNPNMPSDLRSFKGTRLMSARAERAPILCSALSAGTGSWAMMYVLIVDSLAVEMALFLGSLVRMALHPLFSAAIFRPQYIGLSIGILTLPLAYYWVGLYSGYGVGPIQRLRSRVYATLLVFAVLWAWNYLFENGHWSRGILLSTMFFTLTIPPALEAAMRRLLIRTGVRGAPAVIIGGGTTGNLVVRKLQEEPDLGLMPVAVLDDDSTKWGRGMHGVPVSGPISSARILRKAAHIAVVAMPDIACNALAEVIEGLAFPTVIVVPDLPGVQTLWTVSRDLGGVLGLELTKKPSSRKKSNLQTSTGLPARYPLFYCSGTPDRQPCTVD